MSRIPYNTRLRDIDTMPKHIVEDLERDEIDTFGQLIRAADMLIHGELRQRVAEIVWHASARTLPWMECLGVLNRLQTGQVIQRRKAGAK